MKSALKLNFASKLTKTQIDIVSDYMDNKNVLHVTYHGPAVEVVTGPSYDKFYHMIEADGKTYSYGK